MELPTSAVKAVISKDGKVLLLQRNPVTRGVGNWDLPGGLMEAGEDAESTLAREIREELGVEVEILRKLARGVSSGRRTAGGSRSGTTSADSLTMISA